MWSDIACPWASLAVHRFRQVRDDLGLADVVLDHRAFPLELINERATPRPVFDHEVEVVVEMSDLDWRPFAASSWEYPGSVLIALEAVQAAKNQDNPRASEELDWALRTAFYRDSRPVGLLTEILAIASEIDVIDSVRLRHDLATGAGRIRVLADNDTWRREEIQGSPVFILPSGARYHNPGVELKWTPNGDNWDLNVLRNDPMAVKMMLTALSAS
ncbi:DsbA family oxidoreductase [Streptomyces sp. INA 01156]